MSRGEVENQSTPSTQTLEEIASAPEFLPHQESLGLKLQSPLDARPGREFFKTLPQTPGVYLMKGAAGAVLYVGKAKNLRARLMSYRRAHLGEASRKIARMIHLIESIDWEPCVNEAAALLRENQLLRELQPPFNVVNTRPESYCLIGIRCLSGQVRFRLTTHPRRQGDLLFGAFKNRRLVREGYGALLRLIWVMQNSPERFAYPTALTRYRVPGLYTLPFPSEWFGDLKRFLAGKDPGLLLKLIERLLENESIPPFIYTVVQRDLESVQSLYERVLARNRELRRNHGIRSQIIAQEELDDLLVLERVRQGKLS